MTCVTIKNGRGETLYCAMVWAIKGKGGVPKQGRCLRIIELIFVRLLRTKHISGKGQVGRV